MLCIRGIIADTFLLSPSWVLQGNVSSCNAMHAPRFHNHTDGVYVLLKLNYFMLYLITESVYLTNSLNGTGFICNQLCTLEF